MIQLQNIFNYLSRVVRFNEADDDQLLSWALQGYRLLHFPNIQYMMDVTFADVTNHKAYMPDNRKSIIRIKRYNSSIIGSNNLAPSGRTYYNTIYNQVDTRIYTTETFVWNGYTLPSTNIDDSLIVKRNATDTLLYNVGYTLSGNQFTIVGHTPGDVYNVTLVYNDNSGYPSEIYTIQRFVESSFYQSCWDTVSFIPNVSSKYLCEDDVCNASYTLNGNTATFSFESGIIAIEYYTSLKDDEGNYLLPDTPEVLWQYLAKFVEEQHWWERAQMGEQGAAQMYNLIKPERAALFEATKTKNILANINITEHNELIYGRQRIIRLPTLIHREYSHRYGN